MTPPVCIYSLCGADREHADSAGNARARSADLASLLPAERSARMRRKVGTTDKDRPDRCADVRVGSFIATTRSRRRKHGMARDQHWSTGSRADLRRLLAGY